MTLKITKGKSDPAETREHASLETPPAPAPGPKARPLVPPRAPSSTKARNKVLLSTLDGKIQWQKMTPESRKAFQDLFKDKNFLAQVGLTGKEKVFDPKQVKALYDGMSMMYKTVVGMVLRWPAPALRMLGYSDEQKEMLAEPTANLANKFAPALLVQHQELLIWGTIFACV